MEAASGAAILGTDSCNSQHLLSFDCSCRCHAAVQHRHHISGFFTSSLSLQLQGWRVCIVEKRMAEGRTQEWNSSRPELQVCTAV